MSSTSTSDGGNAPRRGDGIPGFVARKGREPIACITAYDAPSARAACAAGVDLLLVGDSLATEALGWPSTVRIGMEEMLHHVRAVVRAIDGIRDRPLLIADMPFLSYEADPAEAVRNAGRFIREGVDGVKVEGGLGMTRAVEAIDRAGIAAMGHIGLLPQRAVKLGGYRAQGKTAERALSLLEDALALERAGAFSMVLECVPAAVSERITARVRIPTIGIGAGAGCDGQILVFADVVGLSEKRLRIARRYAELRSAAEDAVRSYAQDVRAGRFPADENAFRIPEEELEALDRSIDRERAGPDGERRR
ncbi:MAG: 3-methyl-2-oxobutanoate hydroxymethyltransferase [Planctomycetes bacterium]|nr:3-methyl-2-oxobutanoate hydroxymethyltransferase [Planctomycetota bacterium]